MVVTIPNSHRDLLTEPVPAVLTTLMPDGMPQSSIVWADYDGEYVLVNTTLERQKGRNMLGNPKVALLVIDPKNTSRWIEVRGMAIEFDRGNAEAHADKLTQRYTGKKHFYGDIYPVDQKHRETRVVVKIEPLKISLDAVFSNSVHS
jgi:PPOX class probable F420-dependent enzyme